MIIWLCLHSDYLFKLLLIGDSGVGKSCLLLRFAVSLCLLHNNLLMFVPLLSQPSWSIEPVSVTLSVCICVCVCFPPGWHVHRELHQHHWRWLQDQDHRAGRENHKASDCEQCERRWLIRWRKCQWKPLCTDAALSCLFLSGTQLDRSASAPSRPATTGAPTASSLCTTWRTRSAPHSKQNSTQLQAKLDVNDPFTLDHITN